MYIYLSYDKKVSPPNNKPKETTCPKKYFAIPKKAELVKNKRCYIWNPSYLPTNQSFVLKTRKTSRCL